MAFLPNKPQEFTGGCSCSAIRYTIKIPALDQRPEAPGALPTPIDKKGHTITTRFPLIGFDHCLSCRRACGAPVQLWIIVPNSWASFTLQRRDADRAGSYSDPFSPTEATAYTTSDFVQPSKEVLETTYLGVYESSPKTHRSFCTRCGTPLTYAFIGERPPSWNLGPVMDIAAGTMDQESFEQIKPDRHLWWEDGTDWVKKELREGDGRVLIQHPTGSVSTKLED